jgi:hypothetical protein
MESKSRIDPKAYVLTRIRNLTQRRQESYAARPWRPGWRRWRWC